MPSWNLLRAAALDAVTVLSEVLGDDTADEPRLITAYLEAKSSLAAAFAELSAERYGAASLDEAIRLVETAFRAYTDVPKKYRRVRRFSASHRVLLAYLSKHEGIPVPITILKMVNGEQSETGRRTRELRTLGFDLEAVRSGGQDAYVLRRVVPDASLGALRQIAYQMREDRTLEKRERDNLIGELGIDD